MRTPPRIYGIASGDMDELQQRVEALNLQINRDYWAMKDRGVDVLAAVTAICGRYDLTPARACSILNLAPGFCEKHFSIGAVA